MPRLFTALELPAAIAARLALLAGGLAGARWLDPAEYHITLRFIGDVDAMVARDVDAVLRGLRREALAVTVEGLAAFGGAKPRAIVAVVKATAPLAELQAEQERSMQRIGCPAETRRFRPHVTLARLRRTPPPAVADYIATRAFLPLPPFTASRVVLLSSRDAVGGGPYREEAAYPLE